VTVRHPFGAAVEAGDDAGALAALSLARRLGKVEYRHVKRAHNELADQLVNDALDAA